MLVGVVSVVVHGLQMQGTLYHNRKRDIVCVSFRCLLILPSLSHTIQRAKLSLTRLWCSPRSVTPAVEDYVKLHASSLHGQRTWVALHWQGRCSSALAVRRDWMTAPPGRLSQDARPTSILSRMSSLFFVSDRTLSVEQPFEN